MSRLVVFIFAGREENMEVQRPYLERILEQRPDAQVHLWDLTRRASDAAYIRRWEAEHPRVKVLGMFHPGHPIRCMYPGAQRRLRGYPPCRCVKHRPPYESPYRWYAAHAEQYSDTVFMKIDDDVLFLETDRLDDLLDPLVDFPDTVFSANVINNAVCAKYSLDVGYTQIEFNLGSPNDPRGDRDWWELHTMANFARWSHDRFLASADKMLADVRKYDPAPEYQPTREGEAISINCIAFTFQVMQHLADEFRSNPRLGDEGAVDALLPHIVTTFHAAHLTFGPQEKTMSTFELDDYRAAYAALSKEYLR